MRFLFLLLFAAVSFPAYGQNVQNDTLSSYMQFDSSSSFGFLTSYFPPFLIENGISMKSFIRSRVFKDIRASYGDRKAFDAIFVRAMSLTNDNTAVALLLSAVASFDHRLVGLKIPLFALFFPLTDESESEFNARIKNLPRYLYTDSPQSKTSDRDKLQHFFGSAFVAYVFESGQAAETVGDFIEIGEDLIIVDGVLDQRDRRANRQGHFFGLALLENNHRFPSEFLDLSGKDKQEEMEDGDPVENPGE